MTRKRTNPPTQKVPLTMRALLARINRKLANEGQAGRAIKAPRGERLQQEVGDYYVIDYSMNAIMSKHVDPEELGRELGVLHPWEEVRP